MNAWTGEHEELRMDEMGKPKGTERPASESDGRLREQDVTELDRLDEGDLSESEKLPGE